MPQPREAVQGHALVITFSPRNVKLADTVPGIFPAPDRLPAGICFSI
jgi:hypothetical protein